MSRFKSKSIPMITVTDWEDSPPMTTTYIHGTLRLDTDAVYRAATSLDGHDGRGRYLFIDAGDGTHRKKLALRPCTEDYIGTFFATLAHLLDYFATFAAHDAFHMPHMSTLFFHLLTRIQHSAATLPHAFYEPQALRPACEHAETFSTAYADTIELLNRVIQARKPSHCEDIVHGAEGLVEAPLFRCGEFVAGLKPWAQFLCQDSPGCDGAFADILGRWKKGMATAESVDASASANQTNLGEGKKEGEQGEEKPKNKSLETRRLVPMGALVLVEKHVDRAHELAEEYADRTEGVDKDDVMGQFIANVSPTPPPPPKKPAVAQFPPTPPQIPSYTRQTTTYPSISSHGTHASQNLVTPFLLPATVRTSIKRHPDLLDPSLVDENPNLWLLDEAVGNYRGDDPVDLPLNQGNANTSFCMAWVVSSRMGGNMATGEEGKKGKDGKEVMSPAERIVGKGVLEDMWDEWEC